MAVKRITPQDAETMPLNTTSEEQGLGDSFDSEQVDQDVIEAEQEEMREQKRLAAKATPIIIRKQDIPTRVSATVSAVEADQVLGEKRRAIKAALDKQPKVKILIPLRDEERKYKDRAYEQVRINGYRMDIKKGVMIDVPEQVAQMIADAYQFTLSAGENYLIDNLGSKRDDVTGAPKDPNALN